MNVSRIIDRLVGGLKQLYGLFNYSENYNSKLEKVNAEPNDSLYTAVIKVQAHGYYSLKNRSFTSEYNSVRCKLINIIFGKLYVFGAGIGETTCSTSGALTVRSRYDDLMLFVEILSEVLSPSNISSSSNSNSNSNSNKIDSFLLKNGKINRAAIANMIASIDYAAKNSSFKREGKESDHQQLIAAAAQAKTLQQKRKPYAEIVDRSYKCSENIQLPNGKWRKMFLNPEEKIRDVEDKISQSQASANTQLGDFVSDLRDDRVYGFFLQAVFVKNGLHQLVPTKEARVLNLVSINDWKNMLDIMGIVVDPTIKQGLITTLIQTKIRIDDLLTQFYLVNKYRGAFTTDSSGNALDFTSLAGWAYTLIACNFLDQVMRTKDSRSVASYNPKEIFEEGVTDLESFFTINKDKLSSMVDSNACFVVEPTIINPTISVWNQIPKHETDKLIEKFCEDYVFFQEMMTETDTQKEVERKLEEQKDAGIDFPVIYDGVLLEMKNNILARDSRREKLIQIIIAYENAKLQAQSQALPPQIPQKIKPIGRRFTTTNYAAAAMNFKDQYEDFSMGSQKEIEKFFNETMSLNSAEQQTQSMMASGETDPIISEFVSELFSVSQDPEIKPLIEEASSEIKSKYKGVGVGVDVEDEYVDEGVEGEYEGKYEDEGEGRSASASDYSMDTSKSASASVGSDSMSISTSDQVPGRKLTPAEFAAEEAASVFKSDIPFSYSNMVLSSDEPPPSISSSYSRAKSLTNIESDSEDEDPFPISKKRPVAEIVPNKKRTVAEIVPNILEPKAENPEQSKKTRKESTVEQKNVNKLLEANYPEFEAQKARVKDQKARVKDQNIAPIDWINTRKTTPAVVRQDLLLQKKQLAAEQFNKQFNKGGNMDTGGRKTKKYKQKRKQTKKKPNKRKTVKRIKPNKRSTKKQGKKH
jgi:hypothetical protein